MLFTRRVPDSGPALLRAAGLVVDIIDQDEAPTRDVVLARCNGAAAMVATPAERIDGELLEAAGASLRIVANFAVGFDNIDVAACTARRVWASNTPGVLTEATADIAWALILACARRVLEGDQMVRAGAWKGWAPLQLLGLELNGAVLGIVGAGRIGTAVARRAAAFGMQILYHARHDSRAVEAHGGRRAPLDALLAASDVLSLHCPLTPETRGMIGAAELGRMKPTAIVINTSRGPVVDEAALVAALRAGRLRAAGLDVYEREPLLAEGLTALSNVVLLPHLGSGTESTRDLMSLTVARNVLDVLGGGRPRNALNDAG